MKNLFSLDFKSFIFGFFLGLILLGITTVIVMPSLMIRVSESKYTTVDETVTKLQESIKSHNWSSPMVRDMNKAMEEGGTPSKREVKLVELCKAKYAQAVLETNPEVSTLMPCAWGVYNGNDGKIYISGMNMGLMGKLFGGNIAKIMGGSVAKEEEEMLKEVIK